MTSDYERLMERMDRRCPGAASRLSEIQTFSEEAGEAVPRELLETGCLSQNMANIEAARREMLCLPPDWAAEMPRGAFPEACAWLVKYGEGLKDPEVDEAIGDLADQKEAEDVSAL